MSVTQRLSNAQCVSSSLPSTSAYSTHKLEQHKHKMHLQIHNDKCFLIADWILIGLINIWWKLWNNFAMQNLDLTSAAKHKIII